MYNKYADISIVEYIFLLNYETAVCLLLIGTCFEVMVEKLCFFCELTCFSSISVLVIGCLQVFFPEINLNYLLQLLFLVNKFIALVFLRILTSYLESFKIF